MENKDDNLAQVGKDVEKQLDILENWMAGKPVKNPKPQAVKKTQPEESKADLESKKRIGQALTDSNKTRISLED